MKKILPILLCLIFVCSIAVFITKEYLDKSNESEKPSQDPPSDKQLPYTFISEQERLTWKDKIANALSVANPYEEIEPWILGAALMDLNFDNTPEVIVIGAGGSMGNVYVGVYDLESAEKLCNLGYTPHYQDCDNVYLCMHRNNDGSYILVNEGALRNGLERYMITSLLNDQFNYDVLFEKVVTSDENYRYYCYENEVDKDEFEKQKEQFKNDYKAIPETQMKIIYWDTIEAKTKNQAISEMADKLVNSEQQFISFDIDTTAHSINKQQTFTDYKQAYLNFLKDKQESHIAFALVFIDNDDIPELYLSGVCEAEGDMVCSFKNGTVITQQLKRSGGGKYIEQSGDIINQNGNMGRCYTNVYKLNENAFNITLNALSIENVEHIEGEEYNFTYEYFVENTSVSEEEYNDAINSAFDFSRATRLDENAVSYGEIIQQLKDGYFDGK